MLHASNSRRLLSVVTLASFLPIALLGGCATDAPAPPPSERLEVTLRDQAGAVLQTLTPTVDELLANVDTLPVFEADGVATTDAAAVLHANLVSLPTRDGKHLVLRREGDRLVRELHGDAAVPIMAVEWNDDLDHMVFHSANSNVALDFTGLSPAQAEQFVGYSAVAALDGYREAIDGARVAPVVIIVGLAVVGYLGCITLGSYMCERAANTACGAGNVDDYKTICGAGYDVEGKFQLGYNCSIKCKPAPTPAPSPTATATPEPSPTATATPAPSPEPSASPSPAATPEPSPSAP